MDCEAMVADLSTKLLLQGYPPLRAIELADEFVMELNKRAIAKRSSDGKPEDEP